MEDKMRKLLLILTCLTLLSLGVRAQAGTITLTLPEFSSPYHDPGTYYDTYKVGTFNFDLTGQVITSAVISGQWGNSGDPTTAHNELWITNPNIAQRVANTHDYSPDPSFNSNVLWSFTFSDFGVLSLGTADFYTVQTSEYYVRLGETTLTIETAPVPLPPALLLFGSGLLGLVGLRRLRKS
jgi:hypothetical protein